jgi:hypothetical protein
MHLDSGLLAMTNNERMTLRMRTSYIRFIHELLLIGQPIKLNDDAGL